MNHNPEFTSCEFYRAYSTLEDLITTTERLFQGLDNLSRNFANKSEASLPIPDFESTIPYRRLDFTSTIESCLNRALPDLRSPKATNDLLAIFEDHDISTPASPTLPRLLDKLSSTLIEPRCQAPTFITHHPECLAPLAKSFIHPQTGQKVAASAELFVKGQEIANMYEEENSPFEQRRKFEEALRYRDDNANLDHMPSNNHVNESYLEALEWGLPPTGGWGCGIDRLVMLFSGAGRIGDVLTFGTLRNVVNLASVVKPVKKPNKVVRKAAKVERKEPAETQIEASVHDNEDGFARVREQDQGEGIENKVETTENAMNVDGIENVERLTEVRYRTASRRIKIVKERRIIQRILSGIERQCKEEMKEDIIAVNMLERASRSPQGDIMTAEGITKTTNELWRKYEARQQKTSQRKVLAEKLKDLEARYTENYCILTKTNSELQRLRKQQTSLSPKNSLVNQKSDARQHPQSDTEVSLAAEKLNRQEQLKGTAVDSLPE